MLQVFRDGLISFFVYPFMVYLALLSWGVISKLLSVNRVGGRHLKQHYVLPASKAAALKPNSN
jgi:hypothetical protein